MDLVPNEIKLLNSLKSPKLKIKIWIPEGCPCTLFKRYMYQVGFPYIKTFRGQNESKTVCYYYYHLNFFVS